MMQFDAVAKKKSVQSNFFIYLFHIVFVYKIGLYFKLYSFLFVKFILFQFHSDLSSTISLWLKKKLL